MSATVYRRLSGIETANQDVHAKAYRALASRLRGESGIMATMRRAVRTVLGL
jgi:hypothetical protein